MKEFFVREGAQINKHPALGYLSVSVGNRKRRKAPINVSLIFNEHQEIGYGKYLSYRLVGARVEFKLAGCKAHNNKTALDYFLEHSTTLQIEQRDAVASTDSKDSHSKSTSSAKASKSSEIGAGLEISTKNSRTGSATNEQTTKFEHRNLNVVRGGGGSQLIFKIEATTGLSLLGGVSPENWFDIETGDSSAKITAELKVMPDDIDIRGMGGIWPKDLSPRKRRLIRFLALAQLDYSPYLSRSEMQMILDRDDQLEKG